MGVYVSAAHRAALTPSQRRLRDAVVGETPDDLRKQLQALHRRSHLGADPDDVAAVHAWLFVQHADVARG